MALNIHVSEAWPTDVKHWEEKPEKETKFSSWKLIPSSLRWRLNKDALFKSRTTRVKGAQKNAVCRTMIATRAVPSWTSRCVAAIKLGFNVTKCTCTVASMRWQWDILSMTSKNCKHLVRQKGQDYYAKIVMQKTDKISGFLFFNDICFTTLTYFLICTESVAARV